MQRTFGSLINFGASHHTAPIDIREKFSIAPDEFGHAYRLLRNVPGISEVALISTCNRTEIYGVAEGETGVRSLSETFCQLREIGGDGFRQYGFELRDRQAVRHLFAVASGLDSLVVGEAEILGQVKEAYTIATEHRTLGPLLNRLFQKSFQAAKWVRTHTAVGRGQVSVGSVAVDLALKIFGNLSSTKILVVGAGEISERTINALKSRGATDFTICNRTNHRAMDLARQYGGNALPFEQLESAVGKFDIVLCSTASPDPILRKRTLRDAVKGRGYQPLFLIDLSLPRDVEEAAGTIENVFLYNIDDLSKIADENLALRRAEIERCHEILDQRADYFWKTAT